MQRRWILIPAILFLMISSLSGQYQDFRSWWNMEVKKDISKDFSGSLEVSQRFKYNSLSYDRTLATLTFSYELFRNFEVEAGGRFYVVRNGRNNMETRYRFQGDVSYAYDIDRLTLKARERIQYGFDDFYTVNDFQANNLTSRTRFSAAYDLFGVPFNLQASYELFVPLLSGGIMASDHRIQAGIEWEVNRKLSLETGYLLNIEVNDPNPLTAHVLTVTLAYDL